MKTCQIKALATILDMIPKVQAKKAKLNTRKTKCLFKIFILQPVNENKFIISFK